MDDLPLYRETGDQSSHEAVSEGRASFFPVLTAQFAVLFVQKDVNHAEVSPAARTAQGPGEPGKGRPAYMRRIVSPREIRREGQGAKQL